MVIIKGSQYIVQDKEKTKLFYSNNYDNKILNITTSVFYHYIVVSPFWLYGTKGEEMLLTCIFKGDMGRS